MRNILIASLFSMLFTACANKPALIGYAITSEKDAWIQISTRDKIGNPLTDLAYCRANPKDKGEAEPMCFVPRIYPSIPSIPTTK